ncbi:MAG TPA: hypothetical protein VNJ53_10860 [Gaiellaceae bacterium]|nr:hypothetical protein [Gaiellaceae bacterium]
MYDPLTSTFALRCAHGGEERVRLSSFRALERVPGTAHPAVFRVLFACRCGGAHEALVPHDVLDWAPLGLTAQGTFHDLMTARGGSLADELADVAVFHLKAGEWPWSFYCYLEGRSRPATPSAFALIAPGDGQLGVAVRCAACSTTSVNLVSQEHVDVPFRNDRRVGVIGHVFSEGALPGVDDLRHELAHAQVEERRLHRDP